MAKDRIIHVEALTRVEGEGGLFVRLNGEKIEEVTLNIFEPPRLFESLLRGRPLEDVPDITARICGICPVAYQMSSVHALEKALGIHPGGEIRRLRRLLYCGEWIESHALHMHLLSAPDFLGYESGLAMAADYPEQVERGLKLKKHGNQLLEVLGGRAIHPINVAVGGFYRPPKPELMERLIPDFQWGVQAAVETTRWVAGLDFPKFDKPYEMVALSHPDEYAMNEGRLRTLSGRTIEVDNFLEHFQELQVPQSTALHCLRIPEQAPYLVGPLARINLNHEQLSPTARQLALEVGITWPSQNIFHSIVARGLELVHVFEEALKILQSYHPPHPSRLEYEYSSSQGCAATEAPRGLLFHRYHIDDQGKILEAQIIPPTSQNQAQIEEDLRHYLPKVIHNSDERMTAQLEQLVRSYDPCISCSTHFLRTRIERSPHNTSHPENSSQVST